MDDLIAEASYITPDNHLLRKTGVGGLPSSVIERAQSLADSLTIDYQPFTSHKIIALQNQLSDDRMLTAQNDNTINDFLFHLVPFDVTAKLANNKPLCAISNQLLKFTENLHILNVDSHHVIRAHVTAMDILLKKDITDMNHAMVKALIAELLEACERYLSKYQDTWIVE